jgi:BsuBI/PstI restriction endonuclease domain/BsuBI/PstI restriction endonuclease HTH domain
MSDTVSGDELVGQAQTVLRALGFDMARSNERSALTLLSLLSLSPGDAWAAARRDLHGVAGLMRWMAEHFGKAYAPNSREGVRRQTLHQFVDVALVVLNPDDPSRPVNSSANVYQIDARAHELLRRFQTPEWEEALASYLEERPGLITAYAAEREQAMIPVALPDGTRTKLTPGGQNVLIGAILEQFCSRWTPGGRVLYIGDAGRNTPIFDIEGLAEEGVVLEKHGKLPDLIVSRPGRDWLVLIEAASSHGPIDAKRHSDFEALFAGSRAELIYVSCFNSRAEMRKHLTKIAWGTVAWCADSPSHLIHLGGEHSLGSC